MRVLLDECVPQRLRRSLTRHEVETVPKMGWASKKNGELLHLAQDEFDVLVTTDQRLSSQQFLPNYSIAVVVLVAVRNKIDFLLPLIPELEKVLGEVQPGEVRRIGD